MRKGARNFSKKLITKSFESKSMTLDFNFEVKQVNEDSEFFYFEGYASTFDDVDRIDDVVMRGAFTDSLSKQMPMLLWQHQMDMPLGIYEIAREDAKGLFVKGKMPKSDDFVRGRVIPQMKVGSIKKMSIGFNVEREEDQEFKNGIRFLKKVTLWEVSLVTLACNNNADVTAIKSLKDILQTCTDHSTMSDEQHAEVKSFISEYCGKSGVKDPFTLKSININEAFKIDSKKDLEHFLRDSGMCSKSAATYLASFFQIGRSDSAQKSDSLKNTGIMNELKSINNTLEKF